MKLSVHRIGRLAGPRTVILATLLAASAAVNAAAVPLLLGNAGEPQTLDPHRYNLRLEETILTDLFLGLTAMDAEGRIGPGAAESWSVSDDARSARSG